MDIGVDYKKLGDFPVEILQPLRELASKIDWSLPDFARNSGYVDNAIVRVPYGIRKEPPQPLTPLVQQVLDVFKPVDAYMKTLYTQHVFIKCEMNWIKPNEVVPIHRDNSWWHGHCPRIHVPVITNEQCFWIVEGRSSHLPVGGYYEVNNRKFHSVVNNGDHGRLHLVFDIMEQSVYDDAIAAGINISHQDIFDYALSSWNELPGRKDDGLLTALGYML
jgi:hypothetical protein